LTTIFSFVKLRLSLLNINNTKRSETNMPLKGRFIVIEGGDGSGKATQTRLLLGRLLAEGHRAKSIDFPQYEKNFYGRIIRAYLNGQFGTPTEIDPKLAGILYCLDRFESSGEIKQLIREDIVISDRFHTANIIHQGAKIPLKADGRLDTVKILTLVRFFEEFEFGVLRNPAPNLIIYLHVYPEVAQKLMETQERVKDGHEADVEYAKRVEQVALWASENFGWPVVECCPSRDSILTTEQIHEKIWEKTQSIIPKEDSS